MIEEKIAQLKIKALENFVPIVRDNTINKIIELLKENQIKNILEIGTAVGYSGIMMLNNSNAFLTTIEKNKQRFQEAVNNFKECELLNRVKPVLGDALEELEKLSKSQQRFDFVFLDGPKGQYLKYFPIIKQLLNKGGIIFADNILMNGLIENPNLVNHKNRTMVRNMKAFIEEIQKDNDFTTNIYKIDDGFLISQLIY